MVRMRVFLGIFMEGKDRFMVVKALYGCFVIWRARSGLDNSDGWEIRRTSELPGKELQGAFIVGEVNLGVSQCTEVVSERGRWPVSVQMEQQSRNTIHGRRNE